MHEIVGYAVYSEFRSGYLLDSTPSDYCAIADAARLFPTPKAALVAANRRRDVQAIAVTIRQLPDGTLEHETLSPPMRAVPGSWVVRVILPKAPQTCHYIKSVGKDGSKIGLTMQLQEARGFGKEQAGKLAKTLATKPDTCVSIEQIPEA